MLEKIYLNSDQSKFPLRHIKNAKQILELTNSNEKSDWLFQMKSGKDVILNALSGSFSNVDHLLPLILSPQVPILLAYNSKEKRK